jgi:hypothetical protein
VAVFSVVFAQQTIPLRKRQVVSEYINTQYVGDLSIGDQDFEVVFDTSSYNLVVASDSCISQGCQCAEMVKYQTGSSTRLGPSDRVANVSILDTAYATGREAHDNVTIRTLTAPDQGFVLASDVSVDICILRADGVAGMGRPRSGRAAFKLPTVFETFVDREEIDGVFSFHHARLPNGEHYGEITLGGVIGSYYTGLITYVPLLDRSTWNFRLDVVIVGSKPVLANVKGFIDTSKNVVVGPATLINKINNELGCKNKRQGSSEICEFNCDQTAELPSVTFVIGGRPFNISAEYHVQRDGDLCYSGFSPSKQATVFELGDFIIDHITAIFDATNNRMGFAVSTGSL